MIPASALAPQRIGARGISSPSLSDAPPRNADPQNLAQQKAPAEGSASVAGTVLDVRGEAISGAEVSLSHRDGTQLQKMASEANGEFNFTNISPGPYLVMVTLRASRRLHPQSSSSRYCRPVRFRTSPYQLRRQ